MFSATYYILHASLPRTRGAIAFCPSSLHSFTHATCLKCERDCLLSSLFAQLHPRPFHMQRAKGEGRGLCLPFLVTYKIAPSVGMNITFDPALAPSGAMMSLPNTPHHLASTNFRPSTLGSNASSLHYAGDGLSLDHNSSPCSQSFTHSAPHSWTSSTSPFPDSNASVFGSPHQDPSVSPYYPAGGGDPWIGVTPSATQFTIPYS